MDEITETPDQAAIERAEEYAEAAKYRDDGRRRLALESALKLHGQAAAAVVVVKSAETFLAFLTPGETK